jgi:hypothetical protein
MRSTIAALSVILVLSGTLELYKVACSRAVQRLTPTPEMRNLSWFAKKMPKPMHLSIVGDQIVWIGPLAWETLPSGPSCYVFDASTGTLKAWTIEINDGHPLTELAHQGLSSNRVEIGDVLEAMYGKDSAQLK